MLKLYRNGRTHVQLSQEMNTFLQEMEALCTFQKNYKNLRQFQKELVPPYVPFIAILSKDLIVVDESYPNTVGEGAINLFKWRTVYEMVSEAQNAQDPCPIAPPSTDVAFVALRSAFVS